MKQQIATTDKLKIDEEALFDLFIGDDKFLPQFHKPFLQDGYVVATDTTILIRVRKELLKGGYAENSHVPTVSKVLTDYNFDKAVTLEKLAAAIAQCPLVDEEILISEAVDCRDCDGDGEVEWEYTDKDFITHREYHECPVCYGSGTRRPAKYRKTGTLAALFGSKCLPDETKDGTMDETKEPQPAEPKFKAGNRVIYKNTGKVKIVVNITQDGRYVVASPDGKSPYFAQESDLEPYTESKNKDSGFIRAESVKELRIASEETHLRNLSQETANCDKHFDNILKDGFLKERRLNIAAMAMQGILSNAERMNQYGEIAAREPESLTELVARNALRYADALIDKVKKGVNNE